MIDIDRDMNPKFNRTIEKFILSSVGHTMSHEEKKLLHSLKTAKSVDSHQIYLAANIKDHKICSSW